MKGRKMIRSGLFPIVLACLAALAPAAHADTAEVAISNFAFDPPTLTVAPGTTVTWSNKDNNRHNIKFADQASPMLPGGGVYSRTFNEPGEYGYKCERHDNMKGKIVVAKP
jgi:plastocyanin